MNPDWIKKNKNIVKTDGAFFLSFLKAGETLNLLLNTDDADLRNYKVGAWYNLSECIDLFSSVDRYLHSEIILERIGEEMMQLWHDEGPIGDISSGLDFIRLQGGSAGYKRVVNGPEELVGKFELLNIAENEGIAEIRSTTIFPRALERGLLYSGLGLYSDMLYYEVQYSNKNDHFQIRFVTSDNKLSLPWCNESAFEDVEWKFRHINNKFSRREKYLSCINDTLKKAYVDMKTHASFDYLTGLINRREFFRLSEMEFEKAVRHNEALSVLYIDLDNFKRINDKYGHAVGDMVLETFAKTCLGVCRKYDIFGRIGGEEFALVLPHEKIREAVLIAEKILKQTRDLSISLNNDRIKITTSIGIAKLESHNSFDLLLKDADEQLFLAKKRGRNQIAFS